MQSKELKANTLWFQATSNGAPELLPSEQSGYNLDALEETPPDQCFACGKVVKVWQKTIPEDQSKWINACTVCYDRAYKIRYEGFFKPERPFSNTSLASKEDTRLYRDYWDWSLALVKDQLSEEKKLSEMQLKARQQLIKSLGSRIETPKTPVITPEFTTCYCCAAACKNYPWVWHKDERIASSFVACPDCYAKAYILRNPSVVISSFNEWGSGFAEDWKPYLDRVKEAKKVNSSEELQKAAEVYQSDYQALRRLEEATHKFLMQSRALFADINNLDPKLKYAYQELKQRHVEAIMARLPNISRNCHHEQCLQEVCFYRLH